MAPTIRDERQELILAKAQSLIARKGVDAVTMAELAKLTGLSRPAIYQYFASREHVLAELVINEMADLSNVLDEHLAKFDDPAEQVRVWLHYTLVHLSSADHRSIRDISIKSLPEESRGMINAMHGHFMSSLINPLVALEIEDATRTCHLIFASVSEAANRIDAGAEFVYEAASLEKFTMAGIKGATR
jgi:AcrR family transcriptional regulator